MNILILSNKYFSLAIPDDRRLIFTSSSRRRLRKALSPLFIELQHPFDWGCPSLSNQPLLKMIVEERSVRFLNKDSRRLGIRVTRCATLSIYREINRISRECTFGVIRGTALRECTLPKR